MFNEYLLNIQRLKTNCLPTGLSRFEKKGIEVYHLRSWQIFFRNPLFDENYKRIWYIRLLYTDDYSLRMKKGEKHLDVFYQRNNGLEKAYKLTAKLLFFSKESIVNFSCKWDLQKSLYVLCYVPNNTIPWTFWFYCIIQSLININTKTICHCTILHKRKLLCSTNFAKTLCSVRLYE